MAGIKIPLWSRIISSNYHCPSPSASHLARAIFKLHEKCSTIRVFPELVLSLRIIEDNEQHKILFLFTFPLPLKKYSSYKIE